MSRSTSVAPVDIVVAPSVELEQRAPRAPHLEPGDVVRPKRQPDKWLVAAVLVLLGVFAVSLAAFVLNPAIETLSGSSTTTWSADGP
jgi:hypothetical protein